MSMATPPVSPSRPMSTDMHAIHKRIKLVAALSLIGFVIISFRAWKFSVESHEELAQKGNRQQLRNYTLSASRGNILDRNHLALAVSEETDMLVINPRAINKQGRKKEVRKFLLGVLGKKSQKSIDNHLAKRHKAYRKFRTPLTSEQSSTIRKAKLSGLSLVREPRRVYPRNALAAHILGRVNRQGKGDLGIELGSDSHLRGRDTLSPAFFASRGKPLLVEGSPDHSIARGNDIVLTIDSTIQAFVEAELAELVTQWKPEGASALVINPKNGEILALANLPSFDPNHRIKSADITYNLAVQRAYEPGSTMKMVTIASALDQGVIAANDRFHCKEGFWQYRPNTAIRDTHKSGFLNVTEILAASSNICTTIIYERLGKKSLYEWIRRFHFGERPKIQLPGATKGILADWKKWSDIKGANISFGQGISASPLQVLAAFAAIANQGEYIHPTIVRQIIDADQNLIWQHQAKPEAIVRPHTAKTMMNMLTAVVHSKLGTGSNARIDGYRVWGKTSTAQKAVRGGGYSKDQYYSSFVGAVPAEDPEVVILVSVDHPKGAYYGNQVAAPTFANIGARIMSYFGVPKTEFEQLATTSRDPASQDPASQDPIKSDQTLTANETQNREAIFELNTDQSTAEPPLPGQGPIPYSVGLPDFTGLTLSQAFRAAQRAQVHLIASGSGLAIGQDAAPGPIARGSTVKVRFAPIE